MRCLPLPFVAQNGMVEREEMPIAQRLTGHIWDLANKACTEWWCVWQYYCAKNNPCLIFWMCNVKLFTLAAS